MYSIRTHSRGGQGGKTAAKMLAHAFFTEGEYVQAFSIYGSERRGAPVASFIRVDKKKILERGYISDPECIVIMDDSLLKAEQELSLLTGLDSKEHLIINTKQDIPVPKKGVKLTLIDASSIAKKELGIDVVNTVMLGAFAAATGKVRIDSVEKAIHDSLYDRHPEWVAPNIKAMRAGYYAVKEGRQ